MKITTLEHLAERINHANATHGKFLLPCHAISAARIELMEAEQANDYLTRQAVIAELLDAAVVCIRAAEQFAEPSNG